MINKSINKHFFIKIFLCAILSMCVCFKITSQEGETQSEIQNIENQEEILQQEVELIQEVELAQEVEKIVQEIQIEKKNNAEEEAKNFHPLVKKQIEQYTSNFAKDWLNRMSYYGWEKTGGDDSDLIMINQNALTLSNAIKLCEADFKHQLIQYNNNEIDRWCFGNAGIKVDDKGLALIVKMETGKRIDGAVSLAILYEMYRRYRTDFKTIIDK